MEFPPLVERFDRGVCVRQELVGLGDVVPDAFEVGSTLIVDVIAEESAYPSITARSFRMSWLRSLVSKASVSRFFPISAARRSFFAACPS